MFDRTPTIIARYGFAVIVAGLGFGLRYLFTPLFGETGFPLLMFVPAIMLSAFYGGLGPGLLTTALCAMAGTHFLQPAPPFAVSTLGNWIGIGVFLLIGAVISFLTNVMHQSRRRAEEHAAASKKQAAQLQVYAPLLAMAHVLMRRPDGKIIAWNDDLVRRYGWKGEEAIGQKSHALLRTQFPCPFQDIEAALQKDGEWEGELTHTRRDGSQLVVAGHWTLHRGEPGVADTVVEVNNDLTTQKQAEDALRRSEQALSDFFETATIGLHWVCPDGVILRVNQAELDMLGYSRDEYVGRHIAEFHADPPVIEDILTRLASDEKLKDYPARMRSKDGSIKHVLINSSVLWEDGKFIHTRCFTRDVTDHKRTEAALKESEERIRLAMDGAGMATWDMDIRSGRVVWNRQHYLIMGYNADMRPPAMQMWQSRVHPDDLERVMTAIERAKVERGLYTEEHRIIRADNGEMRWLAPYGRFLYGRSGEAVRFTGVLFDITYRKRAEELHAHLAAIVESSDDAVVSKNLHSIVQSWNKGAEHIFGYTAEEMIGRSVTMIIPEDLKHEEEHILGRIRRGERIDHFETTRIRKDGRRIPISLSVSAVKDTAGKIIGAAKIARDISEKKRTEQKIYQLNQQLEERVRERTRELEEANAKLVRQAEVLVSINAELERFAYVASHDLQEPLRMVSSYTQLLARRYQGKLDADADDFIKFTVSGAERMRQLIKDLLTYSRVGSRHRKWQGVDCEVLMKGVLTDLKAAIDETGGIVTCERLPTVFADPVQLGQLFQNLISNALKFNASEPPRADVSASLMAGETSESGSYWEFCVKDNGIGIEPQYTERIFGAFQRLHTIAEYPGTGIGLAICKKIIDSHGGRIWVESTRGKGTTVKFTIPVTEVHEAAQHSNQGSYD